MFGPIGSQNTALTVEQRWKVVIITIDEGLEERQKIGVGK